MGPCRLLWRLTAWLILLRCQAMSTSALSKNRSCVSYGSNALMEGMEHLKGLISEDGHNRTIQCPHNQCCFGIWNLTQGHLQAKLQGEDQRWTEELLQFFLRGLGGKGGRFGCGGLAGRRKAQRSRDFGSKGRWDFRAHRQGLCCVVWE